MKKEKKELSKVVPDCLRDDLNNYMEQFISISEQSLNNGKYNYEDYNECDNNRYNFEIKGDFNERYNFSRRKRNSSLPDDKGCIKTASSDI